MKRQSQRRTVTGAFILAVMAAPVWVPSASAQGFSQEVAHAHLHSAFGFTCPSLSQFGAAPPFSLQPRHGPSNPQLRSLMTADHALSRSVSSELASDGPAYATVRMTLAGPAPAHAMVLAPEPAPG